MKVLLLASHAVAEYDDIRMFTDAGIDVFAPGGYEEPRYPGESIRPPIPDAPRHPDLVQACLEQRQRHAGQPVDLGIVDWAKADIHPRVLEWADVIVAHHFVDVWIGGQWPQIRDKRVIWRTCGQSNPSLENEMRPFRQDGLQIVRYSPAERRGFSRVGVFAGEDEVIRFGKYPSDYGPWNGNDAVVGNITQNLDVRGDHCGFDFWQKATAGLPVRPGGTGSERLRGGVGELWYPGMLDYLRNIRAFLYMGTEPASYTLALIEAMLTGVPVVSRPPEGLWMPDLYEGHEITGLYGDEDKAHAILKYLLKNHEEARVLGEAQREKAIELFGIEKIARQWRDFLGVTAPAVAVG